MSDSRGSDRDADVGGGVTPNEWDITRFTLIRDLKFWFLLVPFGVATYWLVGHFQTAAPFIGWPVIVMYGLFALLALLNLVFSVGGVLRSLTEPGDSRLVQWRSLQIGLSLANLGVYGGLAVLIHAWLHGTAG